MPAISLSNSPANSRQRGGGATAQAQQVDRSRRVSALEEAKRTFEKIYLPSEAERSDYITRLRKSCRRETDEWQTIDAEIKRHPAADDSDSKILSGRLVGKWASPQHDYLYRAEGSWHDPGN